MRVQVFSAACAVLAVSLAFPCTRSPADGVSGRLLNSLSGAPIPGAVVIIEELRRETTSAADGTLFVRRACPPAAIT